MSESIAFRCHPSHPPNQPTDHPIDQPTQPNPPQRVGEPTLGKEVTAELGNVTPYLIVPGPWSDEVGARSFLSLL
jgi:hypothetical protein